MALQVRKSTYRGKPGFSIVGTDPKGHHVKVFVESRYEAERVRNNLKVGAPSFRHRGYSA